MANVKVLGPTNEWIVMDAGALAAEFESAWALYPRHIAKKAALKAYEKARREATSGAILAGIERYVRFKPSYADYAHFSSWLNAGRWADEYEAEKVARMAPEMDDYHQQRERARAVREHAGKGTTV